MEEKKVKKIIESVELTDHAKLVITKTAYNQIAYLCQRIPDVEWSGLLMYKTEGDIAKPSTMTCTVEEVYPMDKGTGCATDYVFDPDTIIQAFDDNPTFMDLKIGHIHSHGTLSVFFSGTDTGELEDNAPNHDYYLSLIVNNKGNMMAKIAFMGTREKKATYITKFKNGLGKIVSSKYTEDETEEVMFVINCDILMELTQSFVDRVTEINKVKPVTSYVSKAYKGAKNIPGKRTSSSWFNGAMWDTKLQLYVEDMEDEPYKRNYPIREVSKTIQPKSPRFVSEKHVTSFLSILLTHNLYTGLTLELAVAAYLKEVEALLPFVTKTKFENEIIKSSFIEQACSKALVFTSFNKDYHQEYLDELLLQGESLLTPYGKTNPKIQCIVDILDGYYVEGYGVQVPSDSPALLPDHRNYDGYTDFTD